MTAVLNGILEKMNYLFNDLGDPRVRDWWLMSNPGPTISILAAYLYFCCYAGPQFMKDRKPFDLKKVLMVYNIMQVGLSIIITLGGLQYIYSTGYRFSCQSIDYSNTPESVRWAGLVWLYFMAKMFELLDTIFFVLRKKNNQVSFLHLYHHTVMALLAWFGTKYYAGGQAIPEGTVNSFIHILMYGYYFVSSLGPKFQKYLWWKKHLTTMQLIQFCILTFLNVKGLFSENCSYPKFLNAFVIFNCMAFFYMFGKFYYRNYVNKNTIFSDKKER